MLFALAIILMQSPVVPAPAVPVPSTNSAIVSVAAAPETKIETKSQAKPETKSDVKDGEKKSADAGKTASTPGTVGATLFSTGSNVAYQPGQMVMTPVDDSVNGSVKDEPGSFSSSSRAAAGEPVILAPVKRKRPEAAGIGVPKMWFVLGAMEHGAATFDAWSTRRNITAGTAHEMNPMLQPFANSNAMYAAVQVAPVLFDLLSKHMLHSSRSWERKSWWVPQTASTVTSILSGAHNMAIH
jgi:hypothetical protein